MTNVANSYRRQYDIFKDGAGVKVINIETGRHGVVVEIKETSCDYIEPFVRYDDNGETRRECSWNLFTVVPL